MDQLTLLLQHDVIVALALAGAAIALIGNFLVRRKAASGFGSGSGPKNIMWFGYGLTIISVALFIIAGFSGVGSPG